MTLVEDQHFCRWERRTLPARHACLGDAPIACEARGEDGQVCGACPGCLAAQTADLIRWGTSGEVA